VDTLRQCNAQALDAQNRVTCLINPQVVLSTGLINSVDSLIDSPPEDVAFPISYLEGLPTIYGIPIWEKLEGEPLDYFNLFKSYRGLRALKGSRSIYQLSLESGIDTKKLECLRQIYAWQIRAIAFDKYSEELDVMLLKQKRKEVENEHQKIGEKLFKECSTYILNNIQLLTPKTALEWADMAVKLQRISLGMMPDKPGTGNPEPNIQVNVNNATPATDSRGENGVGVTGNKDEDATRLKQLLNIMSSVGVLQEDKIIEVESTPVTEEDDNDGELKD
jgi:hypothetical protein